MEQGTVSLHDLLVRVPLVLTELSAEFYRVGGRHMDIDPNSQISACFLLGFRSTSLLWGMKSLLEPATRDSWDVVVRSFMETRDLLLTFRPGMLQCGEAEARALRSHLKQPTNKRT